MKRARSVRVLAAEERNIVRSSVYRALSASQSVETSIARTSSIVSPIDPKTPKLPDFLLTGLSRNSRRFCRMMEKAQFCSGDRSRLMLE